MRTHSRTSYPRLGQKDSRRSRRVRSAMLLPSGELGRARLRRHVFADPAARIRLEAMLHPLISAEATRRVATWRGAYGIYSAPLLWRGRGPSALIDACSSSTVPKRTGAPRARPQRPDRDGNSRDHGNASRSAGASGPCRRRHRQRRSAGSDRTAGGAARSTLSRSCTRPPSARHVNECCLPPHS